MEVEACDVCYRDCLSLETLLSSLDKARLRFMIITQVRSKLIYNNNV